MMKFFKRTKVYVITSYLIFGWSPLHGLRAESQHTPTQNSASSSRGREPILDRFEKTVGFILQDKDILSRTAEFVENKGTDFSKFKSALDTKEIDLGDSLSITKKLLENLQDQNDFSSDEMLAIIELHNALLEYALEINSPDSLTDSQKSSKEANTGDILREKSEESSDSIAKNGSEVQDKTNFTLREKLQLSKQNNLPTSKQALPTVTNSIKNTPSNSPDNKPGPNLNSSSPSLNSQKNATIVTASLTPLAPEFKVFDSDFFKRDAPSSFQEERTPSGRRVATTETANKTKTATPPIEKPTEKPPEVASRVENSNGNTLSLGTNINRDPIQRSSFSLPTKDSVALQKFNNQLSEPIKAMDADFLVTLNANLQELSSVQNMISPSVRTLVTPKENKYSRPAYNAPFDANLPKKPDRIPESNNGTLDAGSLLPVSNSDLLEFIKINKKKPSEPL